MKTAILASLVAAAAAFAPAAKEDASNSALKMSFENELGAQAPLGFWDPLGMATSQEKFDRLRLVEIKHGRIAMVGVVGYLVTYAGIRFPGAEDIPAGFGAFDAVPPSVWAQVFFTILLMEGFNTDQIGGEFIGDFRNGALDFGWDSFDEATKLSKRAIELNQGRAAQMGLLGLMVHEKLGNVDILLPPSFISI
ncbi:Fucoxanthin-chlorophyll a-c binding protein [Seminavis robusta]|uniref:Fucoxanthin-chlorophyll a-c binding protein n=1 Tax=Seminavis robusta TaxID=568900 RepID=A0A9N8EB82_9STRA|nr:Fucoxanthin-chlorophyll a-c binding protein [Seminavis robusta]|eukprot:Sro871_g213770.1 Fucoxanthin-chlorophyll a-c binding protein (194) ;mRNA; f:8581-9250